MWQWDLAITVDAEGTLRLQNGRLCSALTLKLFALSVRAELGDRTDRLLKYPSRLTNAHDLAQTVDPW